MSAPPDTEMRRGGPPQATPEFAHHIVLDVQVFIAATAPLWLAVLLLAIAGARQ